MEKKTLTMLSLLHDTFDQKLQSINSDLNAFKNLANNMSRSISALQQTMALGRIEKLLLHANRDPLEQMGITKELLSIVEIGIHSFCNRNCWFCANSAKVDRHSTMEIMPENVFEKIVKELASIEYRGVFILHRFNEPLAGK